MPWIPDIRDFDDEQKRIFEEILEDQENSWWIKGYAGTGKTMLLAHLANQLYKQKVSCAYVTYTHALKDLVSEGLAELTGKKTSVPIYTVDSLNSIGKDYEVILVDEVQDLPDKKITKLLGHAQRFIFAGDINQSIFLNSAKPERINQLLGTPEIVELRDIHRLPEAISYASHLIYEEAESAENALVDIVEDSSVTLVEAKTKKREVSWVYQQALKESRQGKPSAILFSKHGELQEFIELLASSKALASPPAVGKMEIGGGHDYNPINRYLKKNGLSLMYFGGTGGGDLNNAAHEKVVLLMTLHSAKGLEFDSVFMPFMDYERLPCPYPPLKNKEDWQRKFLYVAITRTRLNFYASFTGDMNEHLELLENDDMDEYLNRLEV